ncbi:integrator complex subunit 4 isoform X2 [Pectinophora gossypiella]|uniref:integrator complex subunit 4 isoform X2 n=1 Tax=Pectinophora gossypiella TaxID=13191 RepID=UPI00214EB676|nr:integrator complex subunit 4 isoform X2 [Pectinophora gossypiella]
MAAVLKKRALAEYNKSFQDGPTPKKLHLVKKPLIGSSAAAFVGLLEKCKSSDEALQLLLRISDCLQFQESDVEEAIKKLSEHFQSEEEAVVRVKILWLFCDIGLECPGANLNNLIDETIHLIKNETSHKVIAQGIATLMKLGNKLSDDKNLMMRLVGVAKDNLKDTSHRVKCRCLQLISELYPIYPEADRTSDMVTDAEAIIKLLGDYSNSEDARVRCEAFQSLLTLNERGQTLGAALYEPACAALADDYEIVREAALKLVWLLGNKYPENSVTLQDGETTIRMVDDAFIRMCSAVNDLCMAVRALACTLLGTTRAVSDRFLLQTLDKQLMSNMKKKRTAHERGAELVRSGAWASGRRWADDAPGALVETSCVTLCPGGAAGAFVHGLEDELMEVRTAAVEAVCQLSLENSTFATTSLDFLVDMFNDEIEDVRLRAIDSLTRIAHHIVLREDQLETILSALEDYSMDVREGLHRMLGSCTVASKTCLEMCIDKILENLKRYPQDKRSTFRCVQRLGSSHATLVLPLVTRLLAVHPFFDMPEPDVDDPAYMCVLILVLNAAQHCPSMLPLFEEHTVKHYTYLRDTMPHLVPHLPIGDAQHASEKSEAAMDDSAVRRFYESVLQHIDNTTLSTTVRLNMLRTAEEQLNKLQHQFSGVSEQENACVWQLALRVCAAKLCAAAAPAPAAASHTPHTPHTPHLPPAVPAPAAAAMSAAAALTHHAELLDRLLASAGVEPDPFTIAVFQQLSMNADNKPAVLARALMPLLQAAPLPVIPKPNLKIRMCTATIIEPASDNDTVVRFSAGLVAGVALEAEVCRVRDPAMLRVRVLYPDSRDHALVPPRDHLRPLDHHNTNDDGTQNVRLLTKVLISHGVWTEPCGVDISICLAVDEGPAREPAPLVELCRPVRVTVAPKPIKRGI